MTLTKKSIVTTVAVVLMAGGLMAGLACREGTEGETPTPGPKRKPPLVEVEPARRGEIARTLDVTGEVVATNTVVIKSTKEGPIGFCPWREGDKVEEGQTLVRIDRDVHRAEVEAARAALEVARAKLADLETGPRPEEIQRAAASVQKWQATVQETTTSYERQRELLAKDFTSQQAVDRAKEKMEVARAERADAEEKLNMLKAGPTQTDIAVQKAVVQEAQSKLELARAHLQECTIRAPFDGVVTRVHVRPGDLATPRAPLLDIFDHGSLVARFSVAERYADALRPGLPVEARFDAAPEKTFRGEIERVYPELDPDMRTRTAEATFENAGQLIPHQFARITIRFGTVQDAVIVPAAALLERPDGSRTAYVVKDGKAVRRRVEVGIQQPASVQVLSGIEAGDKVVVVGNENLKDGTPVRLAGAKGKGKKPAGATGEGKPDAQGTSEGAGQ